MSLMLIIPRSIFEPGSLDSEASCFHTQTNSFPNDLCSRQDFLAQLPNSKEERFNHAVALFILDSLLDGDKQPESDGGSDQSGDSAVLRFVASCNLVVFFDRSFGSFNFL